MKLKLSLDKNTIKEFFLDHTEKLVFAAIFLAFVGLVLGAARRERYEREPPELDAMVENARNTIASAPADPQRDARDYRAMIENNRPPRAEDYQHKASWNPRLQNPMELPGRPPILLVKDLRATAGRGAFRMESTDRQGTTPRAASLRENNRGIQGQRWVVVTGAVPILEQQRAWDEYFRDKFKPNPEPYIPEYIYYRIERAEVPREGEPPKLNWKPLDLRQVRRIVERWQGKGTEVVDDRHTHPVLTYPLGPLQQEEAAPFGRIDGGRDQGRQASAWGEEVAHPKVPVKQVQFGGDNDLLDQPTEAQPDAGRPDRHVPDDGFQDATLFGEGRDDMRNRGSTRRGRERSFEPNMAEHGETGEEEVEFLLFRYFDFDVEPGKSYRYRVRLILANPFEGVDPRYLAPDASALSSQRYIEGDRWSDPTDRAIVPRDAHVLALGVRRRNREDAKPTGEVAIVKWREQDGSEVIKEFRSVLRGQPLDYPNTRLHEKKHVRRDRDDDEDERRDRSELENESREQPETVDFITNTVAVDMIGGHRLPGRDRTLNEPGYILLMDSTGALTMLSEMEDREEYELRSASGDMSTAEGLFPGEGAEIEGGAFDEMLMEGEF